MFGCVGKLEYCDIKYIDIYEEYIEISFNFVFVF